MTRKRHAWGFLLSLLLASGLVHQLPVAPAHADLAEHTHHAESQVATHGEVHGEADADKPKRVADRGCHADEGPGHVGGHVVACAFAPSPSTTSSAETRDSRTLDPPVPMSSIARRLAFLMVLRV